MSRNIQTSTPIIHPKSDDHCAKNSWLNQDVTQQLYRNTWNKFRSSEESSPWDSIEGPKFIDFHEGLSDPRDSYFDRRQSDCPSPQRKEYMKLPTPDESAEIADSFKSCSISTIEKSSNTEEDVTLVADETLTVGDDFLSFETSQENRRTPNSERRVSIVQPFSFELREKEIKDRRESRRAYHQRLSEKFNPQPFRAKPAPNFLHRATPVKTLINAYNNMSVNASSNADNKPKLETAPKRIRVPRNTDANANRVPDKNDNRKITVQPPRLIKSTRNPHIRETKSAMITAKPQPTIASVANSFPGQLKSKTITSHQSAHNVKYPSNPLSSTAKPKNAPTSWLSHQSVKTTLNPPPFQSHPPIGTNPFTLKKAADSVANMRKTTAEKPTNANVIQIETQKPFQVSLPHRKIESLNPPTLMTAKRALARKQFDERIKERERLREEAKKLELAAQKAREQEESARLRKQTTFKARPVPQYKPMLSQVQKRPLADSMIPILVKRRRVQ